MPTIRQILNRCTATELKNCANSCLLPDGGSKDELISTLVQGYSASQYNEILLGLGNQTLKWACSNYGLPVSGNKRALVDRILDIITVPSAGDTAKKKCQMCGHMYDQRLLEKHHFVPNTIATTEWGYIGGVILLCGNCHNLFHRKQEEGQAKKGSQLDATEIGRLFNKTRKEVQAGKYGRR